MNVLKQCWLREAWADCYSKSMSYRYYLSGIFLATILGWASWIVVINNLSPFLSGYLALNLFYAALFVALTGTFSVLTYYLRMSLSSNKDRFHHLNASLRQGSLFSIIFVVAMIFQRLRVLTWWDALLLVAIVVLIEYYFVDHD